MLGFWRVGGDTTRLCSSQVTYSIAKISQCLPKCKVSINNHSSRYTMANGFTWKKEGSSCNVHTRGPFFSREIFKCEAEWPSLALPLWLGDSSFLSTTLSNYRWKKRFEDVPTTHTLIHTGHISRAERILHKALGIRAKLTHTLTSFPASLSKIPCSLLCKLMVGETANTSYRLNASSYWAFFRNILSSDNSGLTRTPSETYWQALQLVKTTKKYPTDFKGFYEPKKKINAGII